MASLLSLRLCLVALTSFGCVGPRSFAKLEDTGQESTAPTDTDPARETGRPADTSIETIPDVDVVGDTGRDDVPGVEEPVPGAALFDESEVPEFSLEINAAGMASLRSAPSTYVPASFTYKGRTWENVGVRLKGSSTYRPVDQKPSLKIKFDEYVDVQNIYGLSEIILNNMVSDYSMMHERVAYRMYRDAGVPSGRAHHAHLTLNGLDYGLYTHVEAATKKMLLPWFEDRTGAMWEFWDSEFESSYVSAFSLKFGEDDRDILYRASDALAGTGAIDEDVLEASVNLESFLRYWAVCVVVAEYDGYPYRYPADDAYIYHDPTTDQLWFLPHGIDESFYYPDHDFRTSVTSRLGWKCLATPGCLDRLIELTDESLDLIEATDPLAWIDEIRAQIAPYTESDPRRPYSNGYVMAYQDSMRSMVANRRAKINSILGR